jgi:hypothetical protein
MTIDRGEVESDDGHMLESARLVSAVAESGSFVRMVTYKVQFGAEGPKIAAWGKRSRSKRGSVALGSSTKDSSPEGAAQNVAYSLTSTVSRFSPP